MKQKILRLLAIGGALTVLSSAAMGQVVNTLDWNQPHALGNAGDEMVGPASVVTLDVPAGLVAAAGLVDTNELIGVVRALGATGNVLDERSINAAAFIGGPIAYNDGAGNANIQIDFSLISGITTTFTQAGLTSVQIALTTMGLNVANNACQTRFNAAADESTENGVADGTQDECARPDSTAPMLTGAFLQGTNLFLVFGESMNNNQAANDDNHTVLAALDNTSFQVNTTNTFAMATPTPNAGTFVVQGAFADGFNRVVQVNVTGAPDIAIGRFIRVAADDNGVPLAGNDIFDIVGNAATPGGSVMTPVTTGVQITAPPTFAVQSVEWNNSRTANGFTDNQELRVIFTTALATTGDADFYQGGGTGSLTRGGVDSDITFAGGTVTADPNNPNAVLVGITGGADDVWPDGRDFNGNQYAWNFTAGTGTAPTDIFGQALGTPATSPHAVGDRISPTRQFIAFGDVNGDGRVDALIFGYDEPVSTTAGAGIFTLRKANATVQPFEQIMADGTLVNDNVVADANPLNNVIGISSLSSGNARLGAPAVIPARLQAGNGIFLNFDPNAVNWDNDANTANGSAAEAIPGTGGAVMGPIGDFITVETSSSFTVTAASGGMLTEAMLAATSPDSDRASPAIRSVWFLTGDNVEGANQLINEQDGTLGDQLANNRLVFVASEPYAALTDAILEEQVRFGPGGVNGFPADPTGFGTTSFGGVGGPSGNLLTLINSGGNAAMVADVQASILPGSGITDGAGNEATLSDTASVNRSAPYVPLIADVNGATVFSAFLEDTDADQFANQIRLNFTQPIDSATVQTSDFTLSLGTITGVNVSGNDIVLTITDNVVPMASVVTVTYNATSDTTRIASLASAGGTGTSVSSVAPAAGDLNPVTVGVGQEDNVFNAQRVAPSNLPTQEVAFMDIVGTITRGATPMPPGTKVFAMIAAPHVYRVTATHNNTAFTIDALIDSTSLEAWSAWLFGIREFVYLGRDQFNFQFYRNFKDIASDGSATATTRDTIALSINASNLASITFTGRGETSGDTVSNGRAFLCWDVLRSNNGTVQSFYANGPVWQGQPIVSSAVVTGTDGRYELHVSAPVSVFNGLSRLSSVDRPVILVVEEPNGTRHAVSSILTSVNGPPIRFRHQSRSQSANQGADATTFNINLNNVGARPIYSGWNLVGFNRASGFATSATTRPIRVDGVSEANIVIPSTSNPALPFTTPLNQFVFWREGGGANIDGMWTRAEDATFSQILIDPTCINHFAFTMTNFGVQMGSSITNLVGGYALAFFNPGNVAANLGCFQFGAPLSGNTLFAGTSAANSFPNNTTTLGWGLFTSKATFTTPTDIRSTNNPKLDFIFLFRNNGPNAIAQGLTTIEVSSLDLLSPSGNDNPNDTTRIDAGQAFFGHWQP